MRLRWNELIRALEHRGDGQFAVDPSSGTVRFFDVHELESDDPLELLEMERLLMVNPVPRGRIAEWVERFGEEIGRADVADLALEERPVRSLKDRFAGEPEMLDRWRTFHRERLQEEAEAWVESAGLQPENPPPWRSAEPE